MKTNRNPLQSDHMHFLVPGTRWYALVFTAFILHMCSCTNAGKSNDYYCTTLKKHLHSIRHHNSVYGNAKLHIRSPKGELHVSTDISWRRDSVFSSTIYNAFGAPMCTMRRAHDTILFYMKKKEFSWSLQHKVARTGIIPAGGLSFGELIYIITGRIPDPSPVECRHLQTDHAFLSTEVSVAQSDGSYQARFGGFSRALKSITWHNARADSAWALTLSRFDAHHRARNIRFTGPEGFSFVLDFTTLTSRDDTTCTEG